MRRGRMHALAAIATLFAAPAPVDAAPLPAPTTTLRIMAPELKGQGPVMIQLYRDPGAWTAAGAPWRTATAPVTAGVAEARFQVQGGSYAAVAFQDRNGNGQLDTWAFGLPKEPVGYSGGKRPWFGRPSFDEAAFPVTEGERTTVFVRPK